MNLSSVWRRLFVNWHHGEEIVVYGAIDWIRACVDFGTTAPARRKGCGALRVGPKYDCRGVVVYWAVRAGLRLEHHLPP
jgi:hypothetical protein